MMQSHPRLISSLSLSFISSSEAVSISTSLNPWLLPSSILLAIRGSVATADRALRQSVASVGRVFSEFKSLTISET